jgi:hypothetical protein
VKYSLQERPKGYLETLYMEVSRLTTNRKESTYDKYTFLIGGSGSLSGFPMEELKQELFV